MATKVRKQVYLEPHQDALLKRLAHEMGVTEATIIRQTLDQHLRVLCSPRRNITAWEHERAFILQLIQQGRVPGGRTWQREALHAR